jgi:hypothetical protein
MEERASTLLLPTSPLCAPSTQFSFSPRQIQTNQSEDGGLALGMDDSNSSSSEVPMPQILQPRQSQFKAVSRGVIVSMATLSHRSPFHRQGSQSLSSSGSAQESDNQSEPPAVEQKFRPPPVSNLISSGPPTVPDDNQYLTTPPDIVEQALEESEVPRGLPLQRDIPSHLPPLLIDLEEVIGRLEEESPIAIENLNPPPDPPWGDHREADPRGPPDISGCQRHPHWSRSKKIYPHRVRVHNTS